MTHSRQGTGPAPSLVYRLCQALNHPASLKFVAVTLAVVWFGTVVLWRAEYRTFDFICNHDPGAALRTDQIISEGARPGVDFYYSYGLFSLLVSRLFFALF